MSPDHLKPKTNQNPELLFRVKLNIPIVQSKLVSRTRLNDELNQGLNSRLILVTAPAGFGKTTAVVKWLEQVNRPVAWFSIDSSDNSLKRFWHYLCASVEPLLPGIENRFSQYFTTSNDLPVQGVVTALIDELYKLNHDYILVMDDYHLIQEVSIHESITVLIKYLPANASLVIISRSNLPFDSVRLQSIGHIIEINYTNLQFTEEEIANFCIEKDIICTAEDVKALASHTEGWPAGLYLLLDTARQDVGFAKILSSAKRESKRLASYLAEEVMNCWAEEDKEFMVKTSILSSMSGPLCDALTGRTDGVEMLKRLSVDNAFIVTLDYEGNWYRYHHLYAEFLQYKLEQITGFPKDILHERAGAWYEENGHFSEAVSHYLTIKAYEKAALLIEKFGKEMFKSGEISTLLGWLESLPSSAIEGNDILCLTYAWALGLSDRLKEAMPWLHAVEVRYHETAAESIDEERKKLMETEVVVFQSVMAFKEKRPKDIIQILMKNMDKLLDDSVFFTSGISLNMGETCLLAGLLGFYGHLNMVDEYFDIYEKARKRMAKKYFGYIPVFMGEILLERNRVNEALPLLVQGVNEAENSGIAGSFLPGIVALARISKFQGDMNGVLEIIRDGEKKLKIMGSTHLLPVLEAFRVRLSIETGDYDAVENWISRNCLDIYDIRSNYRMYEHLTLARAFIAKQDYNRALMLLFKLLLLAQKENNLLYILEIYNLQAITYDALGQTHKSMETLQQSLQLGENHKYEIIFIEEGIPMAKLLGRFMKWNLKQESGKISPVSPVYVGKLVRQTRNYCITIKTCLKEKVKPQGKNFHLQQHLTKREKDILRLLDSELSNAEIAYTLDISVNTVKVNCTSIYRKLDVRNREQAVRSARELKILPKV